MPIVRIALAQVNPAVGDLPGNAQVVRRYAQAAADAGAQLVAFPEMVLTGYPVEDLVFRGSFVAASRSAVEQLAADLAADGLGGLPVVVGYLDADGPAPFTGTGVDAVAKDLAAPAGAGPAGTGTGTGTDADGTDADVDGTDAGRDNASAAQAGTDAGRDGIDAGPDDANGNPGTSGVRGGPRNASALLLGGRVVARYFKHHLPNYGVFDEDRYFVPGDTLTVLRLPVDAPAAGTEAPGTEARGGRQYIDVALTICEDLWQVGGPFAVARRAGVGLVVNINGSPYELNKDDARLPLVRRRAAEAGATIAYVNMVGGQDELVFDGDSMIVTPDGELLARSPQFAEHLLVHDLEVPPADLELAAARPATAGNGHRAEMGIDVVEVATPLPAYPGGEPARGGTAEQLTYEAEVWQALVLGLRDYVGKNGFRSVVLGLSGGIDSSVVAAIAVDALGPDRVVGVSMPSQHSSAHSRDDAADLAKRAGLDYRTEPIQEMVDAFLINMSLSGLAVENLQARVRGVILMALSNQEGHLVLTTGNKSELAVGYSTLYGDSVGGFNPIKDVPKTLVWRLAQWRNADAARRGAVPPIPENSITKPPSAELRPGQLDTDSLPDYPVLDAILAGYVDGDLGRDELVAAGHDPAVVDRVLRMVDLAEYKRRQSAPGTKISIKAFGRDRRLPITNRFRERTLR